MRPTLIFVMALLVSGQGCAALPSLSDTDQEALARPESASQAPADLLYGQTAAARGDWETALAFFQPTETRANVALDAAVGERVKMSARMSLFRRQSVFLLHS